MTRTRTTRFSLSRLGFGVGAFALVLASAPDARALDGQGTGYARLRQRRAAQLRLDDRVRRPEPPRHDGASVRPLDHRGPNHRTFEDMGVPARDRIGQQENLRRFRKGLSDGRYLDSFRKAQRNGDYGRLRPSGKTTLRDRNRFHSKRRSLAQETLAHVRSQGVQTRGASYQPHAAKRTSEDRHFSRRPAVAPRRPLTKPGWRKRSASRLIASLNRAVQASFETSKIGIDRVVLGAGSKFAAIKQRVAEMKTKNRPAFAALKEQARAQVALIKIALTGNNPVKPPDLSLCNDALCSL